MQVTHSLLVGWTTYDNFLLCCLLIQCIVCVISQRVINILLLPGYVSWRHQLEGTWFINDLVDTFADRAYKDDIVHLLTEVYFHDAFSGLCMDEYG